MAASATQLRATGVDFILLNIVVCWSLSTNSRPTENIFSCLVLDHAARVSNFFTLLFIGEEPHVQQMMHGHHFDGASFL